jgi:DNA-binding MarR family transcriptional regulator
MPQALVARETSRSAATELVDALHDATHAVLAHLTPELEAEGLSHCGFWTLYRLAVDGAEHPKAIAHRLAVTMPSVTASADQLVRDGLVERRRSETDRRGVLLEITPKGREVLARVLRRLDAMMSGAFEGLPHTEVKAVARVLAEMTARLRVSERAARPGGGP